MIWLLAACTATVDVPTATATRGSIEERLSFKGELKAKRATDIIAPRLYGRPSIGTIAEDGERVEEGDILVRYDDDEILKELREARSELELAQTRLAQNRAKFVVDEGEAQARITGADLDLELADLRRTDSEAVPRVERENARVDYDKARMATDEARTALEQLRLTSGAQRDLLLLEVRKQELRIASLERQLEDAVIEAPTPGLVLVQSDWKGQFKAGSNPWPGRTIIKLPDLREMHIVGWIHEVDAPRAQVGQIAKITMDAHPNEPVAGELTTIATVATARGDQKIKHFRVELELDETTELMKPGMTVNVDLLVRKLDDTVTVPEAALHRVAGDTVVWTGGLSGWTPTPVQVLARGEDAVAVSGIEAGTQIALADPQRAGT